MFHRKTLERLTEAMFDRLSDAQLTFVIGVDPNHLSDFTDADLQAIVSGTTRADLCKRFDAATKPPMQTAA